MITAILGPNEFMSKLELLKIVQPFKKAHGDMGFEQYDCAEIDPGTIPQIIQTLPFLTERRLVVFRQPFAQKTVAEALAKALPLTPDSSDIVIVDTHPDKRLSFYSYLAKNTNLISCPELREGELAGWLVKAAKEEGGRLSMVDAQYMVERLGTNQLLLWQELQKLITYNPVVNRQSIDDLTDQNPQSTIFSLIDAAFSGKFDRTEKLYWEQRALKVEPLAILGMVAWQLHILALVAAAGNKSAEEIARQAKLNPFVVRKAQALTKKTNLEHIKRWVSEAATLDVRLKRQAIDADEALLVFFQHLR